MSSLEQRLRERLATNGVHLKQAVALLHSAEGVIDVRTGRVDAYAMVIRAKHVDSHKRRQLVLTARIKQLARVRP